MSEIYKPISFVCFFLLLVLVVINQFQIVPSAFVVDFEVLLYLLILIFARNVLHHDVCSFL